MDHVHMTDERTAETFRFYLNDKESGWYWQRAELDAIQQHQRTIFLKARQLGMTWLAAGWGMWKLLYAPGSSGAVYRQKEDDAAEIIERIWDMWLSLPHHLRNGAKVITPSRDSRPSTVIEWEFPNGKVSRLRGMASTASAGHGKTLAFALLDEFARIDRASEIMKAVQPAVGSQGKIIIVSTANGRANPETGDGNFYHYLWTQAEETGFYKRFLSWRMHPARTQHWYDHDPEVRGLRAHERAEQYPDNETEAFTLTEHAYFDRDAMLFYASAADRCRLPKYRFDFMRRSAQQAEIVERADGTIKVYQDPKDGHGYAIGADVATGYNLDYSAAYVIDLTTMEICAEYREKIDHDLFAFVLHYLGRRYRNAWLAVENAGGHGDAVIVALRDGKEGRPHYPKLYRHTDPASVDEKVRKTYGWPTNRATRPGLFSEIEAAIREKSLPYVTNELLLELGDIVEGGHPSPAARKGAHDDRTIAFGIAMEMYRRYGHHVHKAKRKPAKSYTPSYPWQPAADEGNKHVRSKFDDGSGRPVDRDGRPITRRRNGTRTRRVARGPG